MRTFSILLFNNAIVDATSCLMSALAATRYLIVLLFQKILFSLINFADRSQLAIYLGPCVLAGRWFCLLCNCEKYAFYFSVVIVQDGCFHLTSSLVCAIQAAVSLSVER